MDRSRFNACGTKKDSVWINCGCIKAVSAQNCDIDVLSAVGIDTISIAPRSDIDGNQYTGRLKLNGADVAYADSWVTQLIGGRTSRIVARIDGWTARQQG